ncbi:MAG: MBL fold metallo-hydrolase [Bacillota bacterium]
MKIGITYIFHNCFILSLPQKTFLFDYPADEYLTEPMKSVVISKIKETELYVFSSHNHSDHFNKNIANLGAYPKSATYIFSSDIVKKNRRFKEDPLCLSAAPEETYQLNDMMVRTFRSNDIGVAFLIQIGGLNIYFGGDLANWDWEGLNKQEHKLLVEYFGEVLRKLGQWPVQIAFSNTDPRLKNWAGAAQFIETVKPRLFVPMHTFGDTQSLPKFSAENPQLQTEMFKYQKTGDMMTFEIPV